MVVAPADAGIGAASSSDTPMDFSSLRRDGRSLLIDRRPFVVYELTAAGDRRSSSTLIFEAHGVVRRVQNYPADWRRLDDAALDALSWTS